MKTEIPLDNKSTERMYSSKFLKVWLNPAFKEIYFLISSMM